MMENGFPKSTFFYYFTLVLSNIPVETHKVLHELLGSEAKVQMFISQYNRMVWVGRDHKDHFAPTPCHGQGTFNHPRLLQVSSSLGLYTSRDGESTSSLGNLFQFFKKWSKNLNEDPINFLVAFWGFSPLWGFIESF